jgi:hypothetical protein
VSELRFIPPCTCVRQGSVRPPASTTAFARPPVQQLRDGRETVRKFVPVAACLVNLHAVPVAYYLVHPAITEVMASDADGRPMVWVQGVWRTQ